MLFKKLIIILLIIIFGYTFIKLEPEAKLSDKKVYLENILSKEIKKLFNVNIDMWGQNGYGYEIAKRRDKKTILYFYKKRDPLSQKFDKLILTDREFKVNNRRYFKVEINILNSKEEKLIAKKYKIDKYPSMLVGNFKNGFRMVPIKYNKNIDNFIKKDFFSDLKSAKKLKFK